MSISSNISFLYISYKNINYNIVNSFIVKDFLLDNIEYNYCFIAICYI